MMGPMVVKASRESCQEVTKHIAIPPMSKMELLSRLPIIDWIGCTCTHSVMEQRRGEER
jgi:hypothetical protein